MKRKLLVIDTSVMVKWANSQNENDLNQAYKVLINAEKKKVELLAPELAKYEIGNALLNKKMLLPETKLSLQTIYSLPIIFIPRIKRAPPKQWKSPRKIALLIMTPRLFS